MSEENVELVRRGFDLWKGGDLEGWLETIDPRSGGTSPPTRFRMFRTGAKAAESFITDMLTTYMSGWNDSPPSSRGFPGAGEHVILVAHETATMRDTGVPLERGLVQLWTVRGGKAVFLRVFRTKAEALEAAGLRE